MDDLISRQAAIERAENVAYAVDEHGSAEGWLAMLVNSLEILPSVQPEPWEDERKKIADALSEKMAYMNTCLNERDVILGYLGVKRPNEPHCNSDCRNEKCESYHYATKALPSVQPDNDMIHLQKEQAYMQGWEEGREALRKEMWEDGRDRLD